MQRIWRMAIHMFFLGAVVATARDARAACSDRPPTYVTSVNRLFGSGSRWEFALHRYQCEGLVISSAFYTPAGGSRRQVLATGRIAQIHVPYLTGSLHYFDITYDTDGMGDTNPDDNSAVVALYPSECSGGSLFDGNRVCVRSEISGYAWRTMASYRADESVEAFMSTQMGAYNYINKWEFHGDGSIHVRLGLTGNLQEVQNASEVLDFGRRLNPESESVPRVGLSHWHNVYYRLDFDIDGSNNDRVDRISFSGTTTDPWGDSCEAGLCGKNKFSPIYTESAQTWSPTAAHSWFVYDKSSVNADGRRIGYELSPSRSALHRGTTAAPWSGSEVWVTRWKNCEVFAVQNQSPSLSPGCAGAATSVDKMTNDESVDGQDLVLWYRNSFLHIPRDEDESPMPIEWMGFELKPRSFHHQNPAP